jgi:hypothetical protein
MKLDHATGLCGGVEVASSCRPPLATRRAKFAVRSGNFSIAPGGSPDPSVETVHDDSRCEFG